jgi:hypothetical protein
MFDNTHVTIAVIGIALLAAPVAGQSAADSGDATALATGHCEDAVLLHSTTTVHGERVLLFYRTPLDYCPADDLPVAPAHGR